MSAFARRMAWHVRLAGRASRPTTFLALLGGLAIPAFLPVTQTWLVAAVAALAALAATAIVAVPTRDPPPEVADTAAALERVGTGDLVAHALLRAALVLGALALGLALGGLLPTAQ